MRKWIFISASLLPMLFIGCTEHSLGGDSQPKEDVLINFSAGYTVDYGIDVVPEEWPVLSGGKSRATVAATQTRIGVLGVAATEDDVYADCLSALTGESFCYNMYNAEYKGKLDEEGLLKGEITPVDKKQRSFPIEENSAIAVYSYLPYKGDLVIGDTSCYIRLDLASEYMLTDYLYTGKIFRTKNGYHENDSIELNFKHAFAKVNLDFKSDEYIYIDSLLMGTSKSGEGLLDLKNGRFYPDASEEEGISYSFDVNEVRNEINSGTTKTSRSEMFIPHTVPLKYLKIVYHKREDDTKKVTRKLLFEGELSFEGGKEYNISVNLNVPEVIDGFKYTDEDADSDLPILSSGVRWELKVPEGF